MDVQSHVPHGAPIFPLVQLHTSQPVGPNVHQANGAKLRKSGEGPSAAYPLQNEVSGSPLPEKLLTFTPDIPLEVDAPTFFGPRSESESGEGDSDLGEPSSLSHPSTSTRS